MSNYTGNPLPDQNFERRRQELLDMQKHIERELALIPTSHHTAAAFPASSHLLQEHRPTHTSTHHRASTNHPKAQAMSRTVTTGLSPQTTSMSKSISQQSSPAMSRTKSMTAAPLSMSKSVSNIGRSSQQYASSTISNIGAINWSLPQTFNPQPRRQSMQHPQLGQVPELDVGEDPSAFFSRMPSVPSAIPNNFTVNIPQPHSSTSRRSTLSNPTPNTPGSLTTCTKHSSEMMSRRSTCNELSGIQMMHLNSNAMSQDFVGDMYSTDFYSNCAKAMSSVEQNHLVAGAGSFSFNSQNMFDSQSLLQAEDMVRGDSNISNSSALSSASVDSTSSSKSRSKEQLRKTNIQANKRKLAPAPSDEDDTDARAPPLVRLKSKDGAKDKMVAQIPKQPYQRPKHDRVFCNLCNVEKDGFRGAHELHRHMARAHSTLVKKFVCVEPQEIKPEFTPVHPLSKCKACFESRKRYGAYYNAAAHLRRAHFVPKTRTRSKGKKGEEKEREKRGGKGGGDWPPMAELKRWMVDVMEAADSNDSNEDDEAEDDIHGEFNPELTHIAINTVNQHPIQVQDLTFNSFPTDFGSQPMMPGMNVDFSMPALDMPQQFNNLNNGIIFTTGCGQQSMVAFDPRLMSMADQMPYYDSNVANFDTFSTMPPVLASVPNGLGNFDHVY